MSDSIQFYSTNHKAEKQDFKGALLKGLAPDKGLYMPQFIPGFSKEEILDFSNMEYHEIAYEIGRKFLTGQIENDALYELVKDAYNFEVPLEQVYDRKYVMRLDQGQRLLLRILLPG